MTMTVNEQGGVVTVSCGGDTVVVVGTLIFDSQKTPPTSNPATSPTRATGDSPTPGSIGGEPVVIRSGPGGTGIGNFTIRSGAGGTGIGTFVDSFVTPLTSLGLTNTDLRTMFENPLREVVTSSSVRALADLSAKQGCKVVIAPGIAHAPGLASVVETIPFPMFHKRW